MTVFKSNLDDISNTPYKDKITFMIHHNTEEILAVSLTDMETSINPQQIVHNNFDGHQANAEQTITEPFCMDLGRKLESIQQRGQMVSSNAALRTPCGSNNVEQPLDLSPANSPRTAPPKSPTTHNVEVGKPDSSPNTEIQDHHRNTTSPEKWIPNENHSMLEAGSYQIPGRHISPNTSPSLNSEHGVSTTKLSPVLLPPSPFQSSSSNSPTASPGGLSHGGEGLSKRYKYEPILPPCQVCGDNASGYHYGANTCEACKAFFRRALQRKTKFKCVTGGNCEVRQGRGFTCAYCRFQKCNQLGMSLTAIKRGRYTHAKKAENIREVKRLQQMKHGDVPMMLSPVDSVQGDLTPEPIHSAQQNSQPIQQNFNHPMPDGSNPIQQFHIQNSDVSKALRCREEELEALIKEISDSHRKFFGDFSEMRRQLPAIEARYLEQRMQKEKLFGKLPTIQFSDYRQIWNEAGIAVDSRQEILVERMLPCIQQTITKIIQFARTLPGFRQLSCEDQVALIKGSRTENWFIGEHKCYNTREGLYTNSVRCETVDMNDMAKIAGSLEVVQAIFKIATRLQQCYLTDEEIALYKAVAIMQRDRTASEEGATVCEDSQNNLMEALQYLVNKNHPNDPTLLARMLMILTDLRSMERQRGEELAKMCMLNINQKFPPAVLQFMNLAPLE